MLYIMASAVDFNESPGQLFEIRPSPPLPDRHTVRLGQRPSTKGTLGGPFRKGLVKDAKQEGFEMTAGRSAIEHFIRFERV